MNESFEGSHLGELCAHLRNMVNTINFALTDGALHESEGNALRAPSVAYNFSNTVCVEYMTARKLHTGLITKCTSFTYDARVVLSKLLCLSTSGLEARQTLLLTMAATAGVTTLMCLITETNLRERFQFRHPSHTTEYHLRVVVIIASFHSLNFYLFNCFFNLLKFLFL